MNHLGPILNWAIDVIENEARKADNSAIFAAINAFGGDGFDTGPLGVTLFEGETPIRNLTRAELLQVATKFAGYQSGPSANGQQQ